MLSKGLAWGLLQLAAVNGKRLAGFPAGALQKGVGVGFGGPAETEVGDEGPMGVDIEGSVDL